MLFNRSTDKNSNKNSQQIKNQNEKKNHLFFLNLFTYFVHWYEIPNSNIVWYILTELNLTNTNL